MTSLDPKIEEDIIAMYENYKGLAEKLNVEFEQLLLTVISRELIIQNEKIQNLSQPGT